MAYHEITKLISRLRYLITTTDNVVTNFTEEEMGFRGSLRNKSKKETLGDMITSAMLNQLRFNKVISENETVLIDPIAYDNKTLSKLNNNQSAKQLLDLWKGLNEQIIFTLESIDEEKLTQPIIDTSKQVETTFLWLIKDYINWVGNKLERIYKVSIMEENTLFEKISIENIVQNLDKNNLPFIKIFQNKPFILEYYKPDKVDNQAPHKQDEIYIIISGSGQFLNGNNLYKFKPQDVFHVKKGVHHKFIEFTDDFSTWVIFF